jgi:RNA polymerase sigma-70 factor (ECF subfamily)
MADVPPTRASLLVRLRDAQDEEAWGDFVRLYAPAIYRFARRKGLQDADAADLSQEVLRSVAGSIGRLNFDPRQGMFRGWLFTLAHRRLCDWLGGRQHREQGSGDSATLQLLQEHPERDDARHWEQDVEREIFARAAEKIRPSFSDSTWQAFWQTAVDGKSGKEVAAQLGITVGAVYLAKSRVMVRLKEEVAQLSS